MKFKDGGFKKMFSVTLLSQAGILITGFLTSVIVARWLGPEGSGIYVFYMSTLLLLSKPLSLGLQWSNTYCVAKEKNELASFFYNSLFVSFFMTTLFVAVAFIFRGHISALFNIHTSTFVIIIVSLPFILAVLNNRALLLGLEEIKECNAVMLLRPSLTMALVAVMYALGRGVISMLFSLFLAFFLAALVSSMLIARKVKQAFSFHWQRLLGAVRVGWRAMLANFTGMLSSRINIYLLSIFLSKDAVGYFGVALVWMHLFFKIPSAAGGLLMVKSSTDEQNTVPLYVAKVCRSIFTFFLFICFFVALVGKSLIALTFGERFLTSYYLLLICLPVLLLSSVEIVISHFTAGKGYPSVLYIFNCIALAINSILHFFLLSRWGIYASALAFSVSLVIRALCITVYFSKRTGVALRDIFVLKKEDIRAAKTAFLRDAGIIKGNIYEIWQQ